MDEPVAEEGVVEEVVDIEADEEPGLSVDQAATEIKTTAGKTTDESKEKKTLAEKKLVLLKQARRNHRLSQKR